MHCLGEEVTSHKNFGTGLVLLFHLREVGVVDEVFKGVLQGALLLVAKVFRQSVLY